MSTSKDLLKRITALRERLESTPALLPGGAAAEPAALVQLAARHALNPAWVSTALRQIVAAPSAPDAPLPVQISGRARRLLEAARELVGRQRAVSDDLFFARLAAQPPEQGADPLVTYHGQTVAATEGTLRLAQALPASADGQARLCDGIETLLGTVRDRLGVTLRSLDVRRKEWGRVERVARLLCDLQARRLVSFASFAELAEELLDEARRGEPLRFVAAPAEPTARFVAAHALTVAQVMARVAPHDFEWAGQPVAAVATALLMDVGLMAVPPAVLGKAGPLAPADWNAVEAHPTAGAKLLREVMPEIGPLADAVAMHHERLDGTGYPAAKLDADIPSLARMLAIADVYAGLATDRSHRPAHDPRTAITDTLLMAEQGRLDRDLCEQFLRLSFYPVGTVVELTDGRTAVVVSTHTGRVNLRATTRPVVAVLADARGELLAKPEVIDLAGSEYGGVVRALGTAERRKLLAAKHPDLCC